MSSEVKHEVVFDEQVFEASLSAKELVESLPEELRPDNYRKLLARSHVDSLKDVRKPVMSDWDYDWGDSGSNPPPWGDWPDS